MFGNTFKILCYLPWIQGLVLDDGKLPLPPKSFSNPIRARGFTGPCVPIGIVQMLSCLTLCDYIYGSKTGFLVFYYFVEFPQSHVH